MHVNGHSFVLAESFAFFKCLLFMEGNAWGCHFLLRLILG